MNDTDRARDALQAIPPDLDRSSWVKVGMGAHAAGLSFSEFAEWSSGADTYRSADCRDMWRSIKPGGVSEASLFFLAREHGWQDKTNGQRYSAQQDFKEPQEKTVPPPAPSVPHATADAVWARCQPLSVDHGYVVAKSGLTAGLGQLPDNDPLVIAGQRMAGRLVIPARNADGQIHSLQFVPAPGAGKKLNLANAKYSGCFFAVGEAGQGPVYLVEGIATAWAISRATGCQAICCFGFANIRNVGRVIRSREKDRHLVIVPDAGLEEQAQRIAADVGAAVVRMPDGEAKNFDACDLAQRDGLKALANLLDGATQIPAQEEPQEEAQAVATTFRAVSLEHLGQYACPPPQFLIEKILPRGAVTLLGGHGEAGKSYLGLVLAAHVACGRDWAGLTVNRGRALVLSMEDDAGILLHRLQNIATEYWLDQAEMASNLTVIDASDSPPLAQEALVDGGKMLRITPAGEHFIGLAQGYDLILVDNASDAYAASEIDRAQVRGFIKVLGRVAKANNGAMLLLVHIDKNSAKYGAQGNSYSGSTAWHNSARSRLALVIQNEAASLVHEKSNFGRRLDNPIPIVRSTCGVPTPAARGDLTDALVATADDDSVFAAIKAAVDADRTVPTATTGP
ncbi:MAG: AAA family ATPase, partial [Chromatiaceae bacterium]